MSEARTQQPLYDVAHRAVVWQPHPLGCAHEAAQAGRWVLVSTSSVLSTPFPGSWHPLGPPHLAHGLILRARPLLRQNPAPPVANQNLTVVTWGGGSCQSDRELLTLTLCLDALSVSRKPLLNSSWSK